VACGVNIKRSALAESSKPAIVSPRRQDQSLAEVKATPSQQHCCGEQCGTRAIWWFKICATIVSSGFIHLRATIVSSSFIHFL
jgi:hypothetical protein